LVCGFGVGASSARGHGTGFYGSCGGCYWCRGGLRKVPAPAKAGWGDADSYNDKGLAQHGAASYVKKSCRRCR